MKTNNIIRVGLIAFSAAILKSFVGWIVGLPTGLYHFVPELIATILVVSVLATYAANSVLGNWKLLLSAFAIYCVIGNLNIHIEALVFNVTNKGETLFLVMVGVIFVLLDSLLVAAFIRRNERVTDNKNVVRRKTFSWIWRIVLGVFAYLFFYIAAGLILVTIYPEIIDFYGDTLPPFGIVVITQLIRGLLFVGIAILILRTTDLSILKRSILIGLVFAVFGGIAPLIPANEYMPAYIRIGHGFEVGLSNFIYGVILGYLLKQEIKSPGVSAE